MSTNMGKICAAFLALIFLGSVPVATQTNGSIYIVRCKNCITHSFTLDLPPASPPEFSVAAPFLHWLSGSNVSDAGDGMWNVALRICPPRGTPSGVYTIIIETSGRQIGQIIVKYLDCRRLLHLKDMRPLVRVRITTAESMAERVTGTCSHLAILSDSESKRKYEGCCSLALNLANDYLEKAQKHYSEGNYIAANYWALKAIETFESVIACNGG